MRARGLPLALLLCVGCNGKISGPFGHAPGTSSNQSTSGLAYDPSFTCGANPGIAATPIRRLAKVHYIASLKEFLSRLNSQDAAAAMSAVQVQLDLMPEDSSAFFSRNDTSLTQAHAGTTFDLAFALASALANSDTYVSELASVCGSGSTRSSLLGACASTFVSYYGQKAFRRPPTAAEVAELLTDPTSTATPPANLDLTTTQGMTALLTRLLGHPRFFYRLDNEGTLVSGTDGASGALYGLSKYELLSKMTFLFWDAPPDDALYQQVATADLTQPAQLNTVLMGILNDARAHNGVESFYAEWLGIQNLPMLDSMNSASYATFAAGENINVTGHNHRSDMIQEILDLTSHYTFSGTGRYDDLLNSPYSFAKTADLAKLYGVSSLWNGTDASLTTFPPDQPRSGLLTRAAFLVTGVEYTDPIIKGKNIRFDILCDVLPPPPPTVNVVPVVQDATHTTRDLSEQATAGTPSNPNQCMQCHGQMNPLGFTTEDYDSLGRYRTHELKFNPTTGAQDGSVPVTTSAVGVLYPGDTKPLSDGVDLSAYIASLGMGQRCMTQKFFRYTFGRQEDVAADGCMLENMRQNMVNTDGTSINQTDGSLLQFFASTATQRQFLYRQLQ